MAAQAEAGQLTGWPEEALQGLRHRFGGLPALVRAAGTALEDPAQHPLSLCIISLTPGPAPAGPKAAPFGADPGQVGSVNELHQVLAATGCWPTSGTVYTLRPGEFALLLPGVGPDIRRRLEECILKSVHRSGRLRCDCGGATAPDDGTTLAALWLAAEARRQAARSSKVAPAGPVDWRELAAARQDFVLELVSAFLERVQSSDRLSEHYALLAYTDPLTGLPNQRAVTELLQSWMGSGERFSLLLIDGDELKLYNQRFGYEGGNQMIIHVARALARALPEGAVLARWLSGDEFVVLLRKGEDTDVAVQLCRQVRCDFRDWPIPITVSVGVARFPEHGRDPDSLIRAASLANDEAKRRGKDQVVVASAQRQA
nr:hypothetical protein [Bacillota bacterium]